MYLVKRNYSAPTVDHYFDSIFDNFFASTGSYASGDWSPRMEVEESENDFRLYVEAPGMKKKDIEISVKDNVITLSGEKKERVRKKEASYYLNEISYGKFSRSFKLPSNVDVEAIKGHWDEGVLTVEIPKTELAKPRKIEIN